MADLADVVDAVRDIVKGVMQAPTLTVSGTATTGDTISVTAQARQGIAVNFAYAVKGGDTPASIAAGLQSAFTAAVGLLSDLTASVNGAVITLPLPGGPWSYSIEVSGSATEVVTVGRAVAGVKLWEGIPLDTDLDKMVKNYNAATPVSVPIVAIYPRPGMYRNTSRYPSKWQEVLPRPSATVTATVASNQVTFGGSAPGSGGPVQNIALIVGFGTGKQAFVYTTQAIDTLNSIASALAALVNAATPASATGPVITIANAFSITARVGVFGTVARELRRQAQTIDINIWVPDQSLRKSVGAPLRTALGQTDFLVLSDGFAARMHCVGDYWLDDPEKAGLYRRCIAVDVDYATTESKPTAEIIVFESSSEVGQAPPSSPNLIVPV